MPLSERSIYAYITYIWPGNYNLNSAESQIIHTKFSEKAYQRLKILEYSS